MPMSENPQYPTKVEETPPQKKQQQNKQTPPQKKKKKKPVETSIPHANIYMST
jgi:hypothetical protein